MGDAADDVYDSMWRTYHNDDEIEGNRKMAKLAFREKVGTTTAASVPADPIKAAIDELATVRRDAKLLEVREAALKEMLKGLAVGLHPGNKVALQVTAGERVSLDTKSLKAELPEIYDRFERSTPTLTLSIKPLI